MENINNIVLYANYLDVQARLQSLEHVFWGLFNADHDPELAKEYREMFEQFYTEHLYVNVKNLQLSEDVKRSILHYLESKGIF